MRKQKIITQTMENAFWVFIMFFPLILCLIANLTTDKASGTYEIITPDEIFTKIFGWQETEAVKTIPFLKINIEALLQQIGITSATGPQTLKTFLPLWLVNWICYIIIIEIIRLITDILRFIPKLCRKWMNNFTDVYIK